MADNTKVKVLIADDEPHIRMLIRSVLSNMNCQIVGEAEDGQEAVDLFAERRPHITLLDINMRFKTGLEALDEIKAMHPEAFVVMLTSVVDRDSVNKALNAGAWGYIRKDTPVAEMKDLLRQAWEAYRKDMENGG